MRSLWFIAWGVTRLIGVALFSLTEPVLKTNVWLAEKVRNG